MIRTDEDLEFVRKQLGHVQRALESIREKVQPVNERNYKLFAEPYIHQIQELEREIEEYTRQRKAG